MKGTRALSFLLTLALLASLMLPGSFALPAKADGTDNGMRIEKTAVANGNGSYTITLEAYATGSQVITQVSKEVPTDIVLVLDQSGSMDYNMNSYDFRAYTNKTNRDYYNLRHNGANNPNLYYQLEDGGYATVSVVRTPIQGYKAYDSDEDNDEYYDHRNNLYVYDATSGEYKKVTLSREGKGDGAVYTYTFPDGSTFESRGQKNSPGNFGGRGPLYRPSGTADYSYTYSYTDENGTLQQVGPFNGANAVPQGLTLYERYVTGTTTRLAALKNAVSVFASNVAAKARGADGMLGTEDDVNHRIAVVGFASESGYGNNTELLSIAGNNSGSVGVRYASITTQNYKDVLQDMDTTAGQQMVTNAIDALAAQGATRTDLGVAMANGVFANNPIPAGEQRNRVVIVFTDGSPTNSNTFSMTVANNAISYASTAKSTHGATVYTVGIFSGADPTTAGNQNGNETEKANWFMQQVSSNNGYPLTPGYYLSASDAGTLGSIFQQIASNIQSGGTTATLDSGAVVKDVIAPSFQLPEGTAAQLITLKTYRYTGENTWSENEGTMGAQAMIDGSQVSVTGFNFSDNWCGTVTENGTPSYRGNKLEISFEVWPKPGFLGGNNVPTNVNAGIYENASAANPVVTFPVPEVNVPNVCGNLTTGPKNVYLLHEMTDAECLAGSVGLCNGVNLFDVSEYTGENAWKAAYVDVVVTVNKPAGSLEEDASYTLSYSVTPKYTGANASGEVVGEKHQQTTGNINVFKPELTFQDSSVYYGDNVPTDYSGNKVGEEWKHGSTKSTDQGVIMTGEEPTLSISYTPDSNKISENGTYTKQDVPVKVDVTMEGVNSSINQYTTFLHQNCNIAGCNWNQLNASGGNPAFLHHVKTCSLTIQKTGGDTNEPYVFTVNKDGVEYTQVTVKGGLSKTIYELPVGTYSITEDTAWSWRYSSEPTISGSVTLSKTNTQGTITCTNIIEEQYWLNGYSDVVPNIYGGSGNATTAGNVG